MNHPDMELRFVNESKGYGVFATKFIPRGTVVWTSCDLDIKLTLEQVANKAHALHPTIEKYSYLDAQGNFILSWDLGKHFNHSCNPTNVDLGGTDISVAVRDILPGEEITCEYGSLNLLFPMKCYCEEKNCRGMIHDNDVLTHGVEWAERARSIVPLLSQVEQPLYPFIRDKALYDAIATGKRDVPAMQDLYCPPHIMQLVRSTLNL